MRIGFSNWDLFADALVASLWFLESADKFKGISRTITVWCGIPVQFMVMSTTYRTERVIADGSNGSTRLPIR